MSKFIKDKKKKKKEEKKEPTTITPVAPKAATTIKPASSKPPTVITTTQDVRLGAIIDEKGKKEACVIGNLGTSTLEIPTTPGTITTDENGNFSFSINLKDDGDVKYYIEAYERKEPDYSQGIQQLFRQDKELNPLFSTKGCYEGTWGKKKLSLNQMKDHKKMQSLLVEKGLNFEWKIDETPPPEMKFEPRTILQTQEEIESESFTTQIKELLPINFPPLFVDPILPPKVEIISTQAIDIKNDIVTKFNDKALQLVLKERLSSMITLNNGGEIPDNFDPIMTAPKINDSMYEPLKKLSLDYILPGIGNLDNNTVFLLEENRRVVESYLVGLNHEMNRELLWREFPTDQRGTVFSYFWDPARLETVKEVDKKKNLKFKKSKNGVTTTYVAPTDIDEIHTWKKSLGSNKSSNVAEEEEGEANLVLVIKGDVIRRYPDIIVYAIKCINSVVTTLSEYKQSRKVLIEPLFRARLGKDIGIWGFPLSVEDLTAASESDTHFFVLQEQQDLPVFGFDLTQSQSDLNYRNQVPETWLGDGQILDSLSANEYIEDFNTTINNSLNNSASIAAYTLQLPVRIVINVKALLKVPPSGQSIGSGGFIAGVRKRSDINERFSKNGSTPSRDRLRKK